MGQLRPKNSQEAAAAAEAFRELLQVIETLQEPDGCPWDREQTPESLFPYLLEEVWEAYEALRRGSGFDAEGGDAFYTLLFALYTADRERGSGQLRTVCENLRAKMVARHPHVFGGENAATVAEALSHWQASKAKEGVQDPAAEARLKRTRKALHGVFERLHQEPQGLEALEVWLEAGRNRRM